MFNSRVFINIAKQCLDDHCPQIAASLAYATLLAIIPLSVIIYKIYSAAFIAPAWQQKSQDFIFESLSPTTAEQVRQYLFDSAIQANSVNIIGLLMLLLSVLMMMYTIDSALNSIWKINKPRNLARRFVVYLALLIFAPLTISFSLFISTYLASLPLISGLFGETIESGIYNWLSFAVSWLAFMMLYKWVPDCDVKWRQAFLGGTIAALLSEIAKNGFILYVSYFQVYELLYGALAAIPLLLIWIYLTWFIVLIGAEVAYFNRVKV